MNNQISEEIHVGCPAFACRVTEQGECGLSATVYDPRGYIDRRAAVIVPNNASASVVVRALRLLADQIETGDGCVRGDEFLVGNETRVELDTDNTDAVSKATVQANDLERIVVEQTTKDSNPRTEFVLSGCSPVNARIYGDHAFCAFHGISYWGEDFSKLQEEERERWIKAAQTVRKITEWEVRESVYGELFAIAQKNDKLESAISHTTDRLEGVIQDLKIK